MKTKLTILLCVLSYISTGQKFQSYIGPSLEVLHLGRGDVDRHGLQVLDMQRAIWGIGLSQTMDGLGQIGLDFGVDIRLMDYSTYLTASSIDPGKFSFERIDMNFLDVSLPLHCTYRFDLGQRFRTQVYSGIGLHYFHHHGWTLSSTYGYDTPYSDLHIGDAQTPRSQFFPTLDLGAYCMPIPSWSRWRLSLDYQYQPARVTLADFTGRVDGEPIHDHSSRRFWTLGIAVQYLFFIR